MLNELIDLLLGDTITRFVFFPSFAALPLLFLGRASARTVKLYALFVALVEIALIAIFTASHWGGGTMVARAEVESPRVRPTRSSEIRSSMRKLEASKPSPVATGTANGVVALEPTSSCGDQMVPVKDAW